MNKLTSRRRWLRVALLVVGSAVAALSSGCVMPGDLRAMADGLERYQLKVDSTLSEHERGLITAREAATTIKGDTSELAATVREVAKEAEERTKVALGAAAKGLDAYQTGGLAGLLSLLMGYGLNRYRNGTRRQELQQRDALRVPTPIQEWSPPEDETTLRYRQRKADLLELQIKEAQAKSLTSG